MMRVQMAMKDGSDDFLSRTKLLSLELLQVSCRVQFECVCV